MARDSLSVFFPAYNEEGNISKTVEQGVRVCKSLGIPYEVLVIDDGSKDKTYDVAETVARQLAGVRVIRQPNGGYGMALRAGFANARNNLIVYTDADGQFDFSEVTKFLAKKDEADLFIGYRIARQDPFFRLVFAKGWALTLFIFFGLNLRDVDCGFKMIKREVLEKIGPLESRRGAMINAELAIKAKRMGFKIMEIGVHHYNRLSGKPTGASIRVIVRSYVDLIKLWLRGFS